MRHMKIMNRPAISEEVVDFKTCDLCGEKIMEGTFEINEVEIVRRVGCRYPEGGSATKTEFDVCGDCFEKKVVPWLISQGGEPYVTESDW